MVLAITAVCIVYCQLIVGAVMRHLQAGLAIPDLPLAFGKLLPPTNGVGLKTANDFRFVKFNMDAVNLTQIWLHFGHRMGAMIVSCTLLALIGVIHARFRDRKDLVRPASVLGLLLITQVTLGILTVYKQKPADIASSHVAVGALVLATTFFIAVRAVRLYSLTGRSGGSYSQSRQEDRVAEAITAGV